METGLVMTYVASAAGQLKGDFTDSVLGRLQALGIDSPRCDWLDPGMACDIILPGMPADKLAVLRGHFHADPGVDLFIQPYTPLRRKKLFVADMDATMVEGETLDDLSAAMNLKDKIAPITASAMRGEIDFKDALVMRVALLKGMPVSALMHAVDDCVPSKGAATLIKTLKRHQVRCGLVSGGFDIFTGSVSARLGFDRHEGNRLMIDGDRLSGEVGLPIVDKNTKKQVLEEECRKLSIDPVQALSIGDGANDIPMLQAAGTGIGYFGKPLVQAATPYQIRYTDLISVLYMQGYRRNEIAFA